MKASLLPGYNALAGAGSNSAAAEQLKSLAARPDTAKIAKTAREFEAFFVSQMVGHMFDGIKTDGLFGGGHGEEMFRSQLIDQYGKLVAARGGFGIAASVARTMIQQQEAKS